MSNDKTGNVLIDHPRLVIALFCLVTALAAWFIKDFDIDASAETLLVKDNPLYRESQAMQQRFAPEEFILVAYTPKDSDIFSDDTRKVIESISREFLAIDRVARVTNVLNVPLLTTMEGMNTDIDPDKYTWENNDYSREQLQRIFTDHPLYTEQLVNRDLTATAVQIVFREGEATRATREQEFDRIYAITDQYEDQGDFYLGGSYLLGSHLIDIIKSDLVVFGSAIALMISLLLFAVFRNFRWVITPLACCASSVVITMGLFGFLGMKATVISANFIALQLILTLALVIHLIVQYQILAGKDNAGSHRELLHATLRAKIKPCFYAGLTTSVGFASLLFSGIQPVISFGWMMIVAVCNSIAVSLVLFPSLLALSHKTLSHGQHRFSEAIVDGFRRGVARFPWLIVTGGALLTAISIAGLFRLDVENSFINYFRDSTQVSRELTFIDQQMGGSTPLDIVYSGKPGSTQADLLFTAEQVQTLQRIQYSLDSSDAVGKAMSVVNFTELAKTINDDKPLTEYELNTVYRLLDKDLRERLLGSYYDRESGRFRISTRIEDTTPGLDREEFLAAVRDVMSKLDIPRENYTLTNLFVLYQDILERLFDSQVKTLGLVYAALAVILLGIFRSLPVALAAMVPNVVATLFVLGLMGWLRIPLDLMTITIAAVAMGIAVDDTIHFTHHFLDNRRRGIDEPVGETFHNVGYALLYTSVIIAAGFSILGFSDFVPSVLFGLLTCVAMLIAFIANVTLLPVLLRWYSGP